VKKNKMRTTRKEMQNGRRYGWSRGKTPSKPVFVGWGKELKKKSAPTRHQPQKENKKTSKFFGWQRERIGGLRL